MSSKTSSNRFPLYSPLKTTQDRSSLNDVAGMIILRAKINGQQITLLCTDRPGLPSTNGPSSLDNSDTHDIRFLCRYRLRYLPQYVLSVLEQHLRWFSRKATMTATVSFHFINIIFYSGSYYGSEVHYPRIGNAFAFLLKTSLAVAIIKAYMQWTWRSCSQIAATIGAIDAVFAVDKSIPSFLNWDFLANF